MIEHQEDGHRGAFFVARDGKRIAELTLRRNRRSPACRTGRTTC
jgi:hypothetical protein